VQCCAATLVQELGAGDGVLHACRGHQHGEEKADFVDRPIAASAAFEGSAEIAEARDMARDFLTSVQAEHGLPVSARAMGMV
jgi:hypothetical protein